MAYAWPRSVEYCGTFANRQRPAWSCLLPTTHLSTHMRPSEALGLCWNDVDLRRGEISIFKSRYLGEESGTKTEGSERVIRLHPNVSDILKAIKPLHVSEDTPVFLNHEGEPINFHTWRKRFGIEL